MVRYILAIGAAILLGIFNQSIAYYIHENIFQSAPIYYVTACTAFSIVLFIGAMVYVVTKRKTFKQELWTMLVVLTPVVGVMISSWSLFVTLMWWG